MSTALLAIPALFVVETAAKILETGLEVGRILGLPVDTWQPGDPTRSCYKYLAVVLATRDERSVEFIKAGWLSSASGEWLKILAKEVYGVDFTEATYADPTVTIRNTGGGNYPIEVGDLTVKSSASGKTYRNTEAVTFLPSVTTPQTIDLAADEAGSDSSVAANEIDEFVTTFLGLEIVSSTAAAAQDEQSDDSLKQQCLDSLGPLSPDGPADAYEYVCRSAALTGVTDITRAKAFPDSSTGEVSVAVASPTGGASAVSVAAAQAAVLRWAAPLCITPTVVAATNHPIAIQAILSGELPSDFATTVAAAVLDHFAALDIGELVARSAIIHAIHSSVEQIENVELVLPAIDVDLLDSEVPVTGSISITEA